MLSTGNFPIKKQTQHGPRRNRRLSGSRSRCRSFDTVLSTSDAYSKINEDFLEKHQSSISNVDTKSCKTLDGLTFQSIEEKPSHKYDADVRNYHSLKSCKSLDGLTFQSFEEKPSHKYDADVRNYHSLPDFRLEKVKSKYSLYNGNGAYKYSVSVVPKYRPEISCCKVSESGYASKYTIMSKYNHKLYRYPVIKVIDWLQKHTGLTELTTMEHVESVYRSSENCIQEEIPESSSEPNISVEDYRQFHDLIANREIPQYLVCMYHDRKIILRVKAEYVYEALCHLNHNYEELYSRGAFVIHPSGPLMMMMESFDVKKDSTTKDTDNWPGANMMKIQTGAVINVLHRSDLEDYGKEVNDDGIHFATPFSQGTLGAILENKDGHMYGLTAKHTFCKINWSKVKTREQYESIISDMKGLKQDKSVLSYAKVVSTRDHENKDFKYHLVSDSCYGIFCPREDNLVDAALLPIPNTLSLQSESVINKDFINSKGKVQLKVYEWSEGMNHSLPISIQAIGAKSGCRSGKITACNVSAMFNGVYLGRDAFMVESNDGQPFLQSGDSGALITDEIHNDEADFFAYGTLTFTSGNTGFCARLDSALDYFKSSWKLELQFSQIKQSQSESEKAHCNESNLQITSKSTKKENIKSQKESSSSAMNPVEVYNR